MSARPYSTQQSFINGYIIMGMYISDDEKAYCTFFCVLCILDSEKFMANIKIFHSVVQCSCMNNWHTRWKWWWWWSLKRKMFAFFWIENYDILLYKNDKLFYEWLQQKQSFSQFLFVYPFFILFFLWILKQTRAFRIGAFPTICSLDKIVPLERKDVLRRKILFFTFFKTYPYVFTANVALN